VTECKQGSFRFQDVGGRKVEVDFNGGHLSSDGGAVFLREVEKRCGLVAKLARCFDDHRDQLFVEHSVEALLGQRINGLVLGYEDLNDHDELRRDPVHALAAGKTDILGERRFEGRGRGQALAAGSTLNRLELAAERPDLRYRKIVARPGEIEGLLISEGVRSVPRKTRVVVLDFDATDDPLHGAQEGGYYHGYYKNYCYLPLYCFCGKLPLLAELRDCKRDASDGTVGALQKIVPALRKRLGKKVRVVVRGDSAFAREETMAWCEREEGVYYCFGLAKNARLEGMLEPAFEGLRKDIGSGAEEVPCRRFAEFEYRTLKTWGRARRVVAKMEVLEKGENPRFVVSNLPPDGFAGDPAVCFEGARGLYEDFYCARGDMENRIKEQQLDLFADRTSTRWMKSNQLRLWFSAFAHLVVERLRAGLLKGTALEAATIGQIRLKLFKVAARLTVSCRRVYIQLCSAYPLKATFAAAHSKLGDLGGG
jgi:hypothetical protein